ncbi:restriction endonuclease [Flavobacterium sp. ASV13]|uniref:restriction endonuclease n=1 Tax=Flavobacterium sp. ASV13 TaxID=1506583 RepID=UPI000550628E|nr:restriction endonuclease [Flavobacterium sp. ASV13]
MRKDIRLPVFEKEFIWNVKNEIEVIADEPNLKWIDSNWRPYSILSKDSFSYDPVAENELFRLLKYNTCAYCREKMTKLQEPVSGPADVYVCKTCFYWGGRGTRPGGPTYTRGNLGRMSFINNPEDAKLELIINHINSYSEKLYDLTPQQAEKIMPIVLSDYLNCEVIAFGGTKDKGIDALAIRGADEKILVQIKWREDQKKSEAVSTIREVGGTLLARGIPKGLIISTRKKFSKDAILESKLIGEREIVNIGKINIELNDFNDLLDMFEVSSRLRTENLDPEEIIPYYNSGWELFGIS